MILLGIPALCAARAWHAYADWTARQTCRFAGHDPSWYLGVAKANAYPMQRMVRPVCKRCKKVLP